MSKILAVMIAGLFAAGAYAQEGKVPTDTKPQVRAQAKADAKAPGAKVDPTSPVGKSVEGGAQPSDKATMAGDKRQQTRDARRGKKPLNPQGGTPQ